MAKTTKRRSRGRTSKKYKQQMRRKRMIAAMMSILVIIAGATVGSYMKVVDISQIDYPSYVDQQFIREDGQSRTGNKLRRVNDIVIHYVGNEGSTAQANRDWFDSDKSTVSSHFVVGLQGEVIQCVPLNEWSSASNNRNKDTISIEQRAVLCKEVEKNKRLLQEVDSITIQGIVLTNEKLFEICIPLFTRIKKLFLRLLEDAGVRISEIDDVIMVGGSDVFIGSDRGFSAGKGTHCAWRYGYGSGNGG